MMEILTLRSDTELTINYPQRVKKTKIIKKGTPFIYLRELINDIMLTHARRNYSPGGLTRDEIENFFSPKTFDGPAIVFLEEVHEFAKKYNIQRLRDLLITFSDNIPKFEEIESYFYDKKTIGCTLNFKELNIVFNFDLKNICFRHKQYIILTVGKSGYEKNINFYIDNINAIENNSENKELKFVTGSNNELELHFYTV